MLRRLCVAQVDNFVAEYAKSSKIRHADDICFLKISAEATTKENIEDLEYAEILDTADDQGREEHGSIQEKNMCDRRLVHSILFRHFLS